MNTNVTTRPLKENLVPAPKKVENEVPEQMEMSAVGEDMEVCFSENDAKTYLDSRPVFHIRLWINMV